MGELLVEGLTVALSHEGLRMLFGGPVVALEGGSGTHCARTVHLFHLDNLPDAIVLLCCCPVRCRVAELVPHFTLHALKIASYMLFLGL